MERGFVRANAIMDSFADHERRIIALERRNRRGAGT